MLLLWFAAYLQQSWHLNDQHFGVLWLVTFALPITTIWLLQRAQRWPVATMPELYLGYLQLPWQLGLAGVFAYCAILPNQMDALGLPLLNIPDAIMAISGAMICGFIWQLPASRDYRSAFVVTATFIWLNTILLRCLHHQFAIPYQIEELLDDATDPNRAIYFLDCCCYGDHVTGKQTTSQILVARWTWLDGGCGREAILGRSSRQWLVNPDYFVFVGRRHDVINWLFLANPA